MGNWPITVLTLHLGGGGGGAGRKPPLTLQLHLLLFPSPKVFEKTGPNVSCCNTHFLVELKLIPLEKFSRWSPADVK